MRNLAVDRRANGELLLAMNQKLTDVIKWKYTNVTKRISFAMIPSDFGLLRPGNATATAIVSL